MYSFFDGHCDTLTTAMERNLTLFDNDCHISLKKLWEFDAPVQIFAIWLKREYAGSYYRRTMNVIDFFYTQLEEFGDYIRFAGDDKDIEKNRRDKKISGILSLEGGEALEGRLENVGIFYNRGVRSITLTWNGSNELGDGVGGERDNGLTDFGKSVIKEMNRLGMLVDVSHLAERGFWEACEVSSFPIAATHSSCRHLRDVQRNLSDSQIKALAQKGGVIGINMYPHFLTHVENATIDDVLRHIDHIVELVGHRHVALGCDYDGIDRTPDGLWGVECLEKLGYRLESIYGEHLMEDIMINNWRSLLKSLGSV